MAKKPLRSQLNQIRAWVRQGRTDAWIAHQLDVSASELREFRRRHELSAEDEDTGEVELRDEIEAEIEALSEAEDEDEDEEPAEDEEAADADEAEDGAEKDEGQPSGRRRRRRRRGGRGGRGGGAGGDRPGAAMEATFDHGDTEGFGLWLDPSVEDNPVYSEHWAGHRRVEVTIEPDRIVVKRV
jgi:uncharacterized protein YjcR